VTRSSNSSSSGSSSSSSGSGFGGEHHSWVCLARLVVGRKEGELRLALDQRVRLAWQPALHSMLLAAAEDAAALLTTLFPVPAAAKSGGGGRSCQMITHINITEKVSLLMTTGLNYLSVLNYLLSVVLMCRSLPFVPSFEEKGIKRKRRGRGQIVTIFKKLIEKRN
jgi:hypothetical protein